MDENATATAAHGLIAAMQHPGPVTSALIVITALMALKHRPSFSAAVAAVPVAYMFTDMYLAVLHMFLDHEKSASHALPPIRELADSFQQHHASTTETITGNHMKDIDTLVSTVAIVLLFWHAAATVMRKELPRVVYLWSLLVLLLGELAIYNHSKMHARTRALPPKPPQLNPPAGHPKPPPIAACPSTSRPQPPAPAPATHSRLPQHQPAIAACPSTSHISACPSTIHFSA